MCEVPDEPDELDDLRMGHPHPLHDLIGAVVSHEVSEHGERGPDPGMALRSDHSPSQAVEYCPCPVGDVMSRFSAGEACVVQSEGLEAEFPDALDGAVSGLVLAVSAGVWDVLFVPFFERSDVVSSYHGHYVGVMVVAAQGGEHRHGGYQVAPHSMALFLGLLQSLLGPVDCVSPAVPEYPGHDAVSLVIRAEGHLFPSCRHVHHLRSLCQDFTGSVGYHLCCPLSRRCPGTLRFPFSLCPLFFRASFLVNEKRPGFVTRAFCSRLFSG